MTSPSPLTETIPDLTLRVALTTRAAKDLAEIVGASSEEYLDVPEDAELREQASQLLTALLGEQQSYLVYLRNGGMGRDYSRIVEVRIAADLDHAPNNALIHKLRRKSLVFIGTEKRNYNSLYPEFLLIGATAIPEAWGVKDAWSRLARVEFSAGNDKLKRKPGFPPLLLLEIGNLPEARTQREIIQQRLSDWLHYLDILEKTAIEKQFNVAYQAYRRDQTGQYVTFRLDGSETILWSRIQSALDEPLEVSEAALRLVGDSNQEEEEYEGRDRLVGIIRDVFPHRNELRVLLDENMVQCMERGTFKLPRSAVLRYKAGGDLAQIKRLRSGIDSLERGRAENPRLSDFLFDAYQAHLPDSARHVTVARDQLLQPLLNDGQLTAVEGALNAPDLFLIQGPPGTGKTTVIAEICYQVAIRGGRTLIASQANLAVDNAMSCLAHHPAIRALRRGHADRVEIEGAPYLEENVVSTWLSKTGDSCMRDLQRRRDRIMMFQEVRKNQPRITTFADMVRSYHQRRQALIEQIAQVEKKLQDAKRDSERTNQTLVHRRNAREALKQISERSPEQTAQDSSPHFPTANSEAMGEFNHPALRQMRTDLDRLVQDLAYWKPELAQSLWHQSSSESSQSFQAVAEQWQAAGAALAVYEKLKGAIESDRLLLDSLHDAGAGWYQAQVGKATLMRNKEQLSQERLRYQKTVEEITVQEQGLQRRLDDLAALYSTLGQARPSIIRWLDAARQPDGKADPELPAELKSATGQEIWRAAFNAAQIPVLRALTTARHMNQVESDAFAKLGALIGDMITGLTPTITPAILATQSRHKANWRTSNLSHLVTIDHQGFFHPAADAELSLQRLSRRLKELSRKLDWLSQLFGGEEHRQNDLAQQIVLLRAVMVAFSRRRAELDRQCGILDEQIHSRLADKVDAVQTAAQRETERLETQTRSALEVFRVELDRTMQAIVPISSKIAQADAQIDDLNQSQLHSLETLSHGLAKLGNMRPVAAFHELVRSIGQSPSGDWSSTWQSTRARFDAAYQRLNTAATRLTPLAAIRLALADLDNDILQLEMRVQTCAEQIQAAQGGLEHARSDLQSHDEHYRRESIWWQDVHEAIPERLRPPNPSGNIEEPAYVEALLSACTSWDRELEQERAYLKRCERLVTDWYQRLHSADERDVADLKQIYIDNANVIGITCVQAGARHFSQEYRNFDCVIIDEVSKATPPELILPMLKGAKIVLVGDHRQLPPMIGPKAITDLAEELNVPKTEVEHVRRSLFKELFEKCPPELRIMLTVQYRMHPQIMEAINQFYADRLECGLSDPDQQRAHGYTSAHFQPDTHIAWVTTPTDSLFWESQIGTTYSNGKELAIIEEIVKELDATWKIVRGDRPNKEVGVITFYSAQAHELERRLLNRSPDQSFKNINIRLGTVDRFQGMERPIVIVSLVRNNDRGDIGFAKEPERINVAFSRAQELLIIVGSRGLFCTNAKHRPAASIYARVADVVRHAGGLSDFSSFLQH